MVPERVHGVIMYAGAVLIVLGIILACMLIRMMYSVHLFMRKGTRAVEYVSSSLLIPVISLLTSLGGT